MSKQELKVALAGNPNSGKSTLFNALTGLNQQVGNYPGITVDKKTGSCKLSVLFKAKIIDLPGTYSLYPKSLDEKVTHQILCKNNHKEYPDVTVVVADSSNLRKSLLLLSQIIDLKMKVILALNMLDVSRDLGIVIDTDVLSDELGVPVVSINARKQKGIDKLKLAILETQLPKRNIFDVSVLFPEIIEEGNIIRGTENNYATFLSFSSKDINNSKKIELELKELSDKYSFNPARALAKETVRRYKSIDSILSKCIGENKALIKRNFTKRIDDLLLHPVLGYLFFLVVLLLFFKLYFLGHSSLWSGLMEDWLIFQIGYL